MSLQLTGIHHLTAITANAPGNLHFYTKVLGLRLVKKTVNQDDTSAYHLFYADGEATPGTDLTFFDWPLGRERRGTHSIARTSLRVGSRESCVATEKPITMKTPTIALRQAGRLGAVGVLDGTVELTGSRYRVPVTLLATTRDPRRSCAARASAHLDRASRASLRIARASR